MKTVIRGMGVLVAVVGLVIWVAACGGTEEFTPIPADTSTADIRPMVDPDSNSFVGSPVDTDTGDVTTDVYHYTEFRGLAPPSVEEQIHYSDAVVRAKLTSSAKGTLNFKVLGYLKGTGPSDITVKASTSDRDTQWDTREAVLFLTLPTTGTQGSAATGTFNFTNTAPNTYIGNLPKGYTIGTRSPAWMPAATAPGASEASATTAMFITEDRPAWASSRPTISLADLKTKIAWMGGGKGITGYADCIASALSNLRWYRGAEVYFGRAWTTTLYKGQIVSGGREGSLVTDYGTVRHDFLRYGKWWLTGTDAALFKNIRTDNDEVSSNGYEMAIKTTRPLPAGTYRFTNRIQSGEFIPCNYPAENDSLDFEVTVTAPTGTVHEAFFDPTAIDGTVGADASNGVLKPSDFSLGDASSYITGLEWEDGKVILALSPYVSLAGKTLEFIELDGSVSLGLAFDDGSVDRTAGTVVWGVDGRPWESGDELMIRIR